MRCTARVGVEAFWQVSWKAEILSPPFSLVCCLSPFSARQERARLPRRSGFSREARIASEGGYHIALRRRTPRFSDRWLRARGRSYNSQCACRRQRRSPAMQRAPGAHSRHMNCRCVSYGVDTLWVRFTCLGYKHGVCIGAFWFPEQRKTRCISSGLYIAENLFWLRTCSSHPPGRCGPIPPFPAGDLRCRRRFHTWSW